MGFTQALQLAIDGNELLDQFVVALLDPGQVVESALARLGRTALVTPGSANKLASFVMRRLLPRATATAVMGRASKGFEAP